MGAFSLLLSALIGVTLSKYAEYRHRSVDAEGVTINTILEANEPTICDRNVKQYSGYLRAGGTNNNYFYWFFESRKAPSTDPFIMWLTGGPGCSSQLALLAENGPCTVVKPGRDTKLNPYSWNSAANIMWVDQPPGTGFSTGTRATNENIISQDMWAFLQNFITAYPQYFRNGFYVIGESYGGHYVPNIMNYIWRQNNAGAGTAIPLKGFGIGNGLTDAYIQFNWYAKMAYNSSVAIHSPYHGIPVSSSTFNTMTSHIPQCTQDIARCNNGGGSSACNTAYSYCMSSQVSPVEATGVNPYNLNIKCAVGGLCYDFSAETTWLNNKTVQKQLGVNMKWNTCNNVGLQDDWMLTYDQLLIEPIETSVRGLIYAGELDFICNWLGNEAWSLALGWSGQRQFNTTRPVAWNVNGRAAGEIRQAAGLSNFTFLRVFAAGHMVPMDQPAAALQMVNQFISNTLKP